LPGPSTFTRRRFTASSSRRSPYAGFLFRSAAQAEKAALLAEIDAEGGKVRLAGSLAQRLGKRGESHLSN